MFKNIGAKIKGMVVATFILEAIGVIIGGAFLLKDGNPYGWVVLIVGLLVAWLSNLLTYGFGQLVENSDIIAENTQILADMMVDSNEE